MVFCSASANPSVSCAALRSAQFAAQKAPLSALNQPINRLMRTLLCSLLLAGACSLSAAATDYPGIDIKPVEGNSKAITLNLNNAEDRKSTRLNSSHG